MEFRYTVHFGFNIYVNVHLRAACINQKPKMGTRKSQSLSAVALPKGKGAGQQAGHSENWRTENQNKYKLSTIYENWFPFSFSSRRVSVPPDRITGYFVFSGAGPVDSRLVI